MATAVSDRLTLITLEQMPQSSCHYQILLLLLPVNSFNADIPCFLQSLWSGHQFALLSLEVKVGKVSKFFYCTCEAKMSVLILKEERKF